MLQVSLISKRLKTFMFQSEVDSTDANGYGWISTRSRFRSRDVISKKKRDVYVRLMCHTSRQNTLQAGCLYSLAGSFIPRNNGTETRVFYFHESVTKIGLVCKIRIKLRNKAVFAGPGHIISQKRIVDPQQKGVDWLEATVEHNGWDYEKGENVPFLVKYLVSSQPNFVKSRVLYRDGREVDVCGRLVGWDKSNKVAVVLVDRISVTAGHMSYEAVTASIRRHGYNPNDYPCSDADEADSIGTGEEEAEDHDPPSVPDDECFNVDSKSFMVDNRQSDRPVRRSKRLMAHCKQQSSERVENKPDISIISTATASIQGHVFKKRKSST
ncbi:hypothetical protein PtA15_7A110 [Puccinia triticina]|uniref:Uncharacterized protein n=1 Tax=Puccinia triticina TaxID=208348 RepID=A0ABY7CMD2_9BASI|nr:uncharacterized protein PtA15_7A110 [Puccinia triticina]WAQ86384.1 hypothetical protein PtA15_7A110 [Puccinia triticina]